MVVVSDPDLSWAVTKAALVVVSALASVVCLAWAGGRKAFPSESQEQQVEKKTTDSRPLSSARPGANWPYGGEVAPKVLGPIRKVLVAEFYLANSPLHYGRDSEVSVQLSAQSPCKSLRAAQKLCPKLEFIFLRQTSWRAEKVCRPVHNDTHQSRPRLCSTAVIRP
jgi:hypothetical protein